MALSPPVYSVFNKLVVVAIESDMILIKQGLGHRYRLNDEGKRANNPIFSLVNINRPPTFSELSLTTHAEWCTDQWGVPEDVTQVRVEQDTTNRWVIRYESLLKGPDKAISTLSRRFPDATFETFASTRDGAGVCMSFFRGYSPTPRTWSAPDTHKHFQAVMGDHSCKCNYLHHTDARYPYVDCDRPPIPTDQAVAEFDEANYWV